MGFFDLFLPQRTAPRPTAQPAEEPVPDRIPLHIVSDDALLRLRDGALEAEGTRVPLDTLSMVVLHGGAGVTAPCLRALCEAGVPLAVLSRGGYPVGLCTPMDLGAAARRDQYAAAADPARSLPLARALIDAKLAACNRLARRRGASAVCVRALSRARQRLPRARTRAAIMGIEGAAAAAWHKAIPDLLRAEGVTFAGRSRRPPGDLVNASLSYGYACVTTACAVAARCEGLDPAVGFLHAERAGRAALALDLAEPLRVAICDAAVLESINTRALGLRHADTDGSGAVNLTAEGRRVVLRALERRWSTRLHIAGRAACWRDLPARHARALSRALRANGQLVLEGPW